MKSRQTEPFTTQPIAAASRPAAAMARAGHACGLARGCPRLPEPALAHAGHQLETPDAAPQPLVEGQKPLFQLLGAHDAIRKLVREAFDADISEDHGLIAAPVCILPPSNIASLNYGRA
jgi:hypothetical protein